MVHKEDKKNFFLLTIIGAVAIIAIIIMIASTGSRTYNLSEDTLTYGSSADVAGGATRASTETELVNQGRLSDTQNPAPVINRYCSDSDNGKDYNTKGTVTYVNRDKESSKKDYCRGYDSTTLVEQYCKNNKIASTEYNCPYGCVDGACKSADSLAYWTEWLDRDDPSGMGDYEHKNEFPQVCATPIAVECQLIDGTDYVAAGQDVFCNREVGAICYNALNPEGCYDYKVRFLCPKGDNSKIEAKVKCTETDSGKDIYQKGFTTGVTFIGDRSQEQKLMDHCQTPTDLNLLIEYYCGDDGYSHEEQKINCPAGCFDGACKKPVDNTLGVYPEFLFDDVNDLNSFKGQIVIGKTAPSSDVLVALDIAASLFKTTVSGTEPVPLNPIATGIAVLDTDASYTKPSIIINGPCVNILAAWHLNNPIDCSNGYITGIGRLDFLNKNGQIAIMVSGYTTQDIKNAKTVLVNWADYEEDIGSAASICIEGSSNEFTITRCDPLPVENDYACLDSDGGMDIYQKGYAKGKDPNGVNTVNEDTCVERYPTEGMHVVESCIGELCAQEEAICSGDRVGWYSPEGRGNDCPYGCVDGACMQPGDDLTDQIISLNAGWNYISLNVQPKSLMIQDLMTTLVEEGSLELVKNNAGEVYWPDQGIYNLKEIRLEEGYMVKVKQNTQLIVRGQKISLPFIVPLNTGWNLASYPAQNPANAMDVVADLKDSGVLVKVQDEAGNAIEELPGIGWVDNIKQFSPGKAYMINVNQGAKLVVKEYPYCGNQIIEGLEQCDGYNIGDATCQDFGYVGGTLTCNSFCKLNLQECVMPPINNSCTDSDGGLEYYKYGYVTEYQTNYPDFCENFEQTYFASASCAEDEIAIGGQGGCNEGGSTNHQIRPSMTTWTNYGAMYGGVAHDWQIGCRGYGSAAIEAICVKNTDLQYRLSSIGQSQHYTTDEQDYYAEALCADDEIAIGGMGGCNEMGLSYERPSLTLSTGIQRFTNENKGWQIGCQGQGSAIVQALCVKKTDLQYRISPLGQTQHYTNDQQAYYADAYCADDEIAIGGQGGCNEMGPSYSRPSMTLSNWVQRNSNEAKGWTIGCKGPGTAVVEALCVKKTDLQYRISASGQIQHYVEDGLLNEGVCTNYGYINNNYVCPNGCQDGACINVATNCVDTDPQNDIYTFGYLTSPDGAYYPDQCIENAAGQYYVRQYSCAGNIGYGYSDYSCPGGCNGGVCVSGNYGNYSKYLILEDIENYVFNPNSLYSGGENNPPYYFYYYQVGYTDSNNNRNANAAVALFSSRQDALDFLSLAMSESGTWQLKNINGKNVYYMGDSNSQTFVWSIGSNLVVIEQRTSTRVPTVSASKSNSIITGNVVATTDVTTPEMPVEYPVDYYASPVVYSYINKYPSDLPVSVNPYCGNGIQDVGEQCDGNVWAHAATCEYFGYAGGTLSCRQDCKFDFSGCVSTYNADLAVKDIIITSDGTADSQGRLKTNVNAIIENIGSATSSTFDVVLAIDDVAQITGNGYHALAPGETEGPSNVGGGSYYTVGKHTAMFIIKPHGPDAVSSNNVLKKDFNVGSGFCGDGVLSGYEQCDGGDLRGLTCTDINGFTGGELSCYPPGSQNECSWNTAKCIEMHVNANMQGGNIVHSGETVNITWTASSNIYNYLRYIDAIYLQNNARMTIEHELNIIGTSGRYSWTVPSYFPAGEYVIELGIQPQGYGPFVRSKQFTITTNNEPYCGDGVITPGIGEECDGNIIGQVTECSQFDNRFTSGQIGCTADCKFDLSNCFVCYIPDCAAPPQGCDYVPGIDQHGCQTCGELVCIPSLSRSFSLDPANINSVVTVTLTKTLQPGQTTVLTEETVPSGFTIVSPGTGSATGNIIRWAELIGATSGVYTYTVRTPNVAGTGIFSGVYSINGGETTTIAGDNSLVVRNGEAYCGDGVINNFPYEECDGSTADLNCLDLGFYGGVLTCSSDCQLDTSQCTGLPPGVCGDGVISAGEECEPAVPLMLSCVDFDSFTGGDLRCSNDCTYDISGCVHNPTISIGSYPIPFVKQGGAGPNGKFVIGVYSSPEDSSAMLILSQDIKINNFATLPLEYDIDTIMPATDNMIVVGGACANTIAANLLGNPYDCTVGLQPGQSRIKLVPTGNGLYALLVYGYTASDTANAAYVLTHRQDFSNILTGATQVCISGTSNNLNVERC